MPANASVEFRRAVAHLEAVVRGDELEPPPPRVIPMREYYEESEREQNELIALQREQLERLERAGLVRQASSAAPNQSSPILGGHRSSRTGAAQRSMSFAGMFLRGAGGRRGTSEGGGGGAGGGGRSGSTSSASGGITPSHRKMSTNMDMMMGSPLGRGAVSPSLLVRKQSSVGIGMLLQSASYTPGGQMHDGLDSVDSQSSFAGTPITSSRGHHHHHNKNSGVDNHHNSSSNTTTSAAAAAGSSSLGGSSGGIVVTKALQDLLRRDANGRPILLKPIYNPYRSSEREEETNIRRRLRPHTLELLQPLSFEKASEACDPTLYLRKSHEELSQHHHNKQHNTFSGDGGQRGGQDGEQQQLLALRHDPATLRERMEFWRSRESDQLEVFSRAAAAAVSSERVRWEDVNKRERGILAKVEKVQKNAAAIQAARNHERQRLEDLKLESQCRVELECLINAEESFRNRYIATEGLLWAELMTDASLGEARR